MKKSTLALVLLTALGAACDAATLPALPPVTGGEGALRFDYSGARSGSFLARGEGTPPDAIDYAAAKRAGGWIDIFATRTGAGGTYDQLRIAFPDRPAPYTATIDWTKCPADAACAGGVAFLDYPSGNPNAGNVFMFSSGEVHVTRIANGRVQGTFSGSGLGTRGEGMLRYEEGSFDVPILPN